MFSSLLIAAAAATGQPSLPSINVALKDGDYPTWALNDSVSAGALLRIETRENGSVKSCSVRSHVGDARLAKEMCSIASRSVLRPARDGNGKAVPAIFDAQRHWIIPGTAQGTEVATSQFRPVTLVTLKVPSLPNGSEEMQVPVAVSYAPDGRFTGCAAMERESDKSLVKRACRTASNTLGNVVMDDGGVPTAYVTRIDIMFKEGAE